MKTTWLLAALAFVAMLLQAFGKEGNIVHGITVNDVFLGGVFGLLALQIALGQPLGAEERPLIGAFALWCAFGVVSWAIVSAAGFYPSYEPIHAGLLLKQRLFEHALIFGAFFFGAQ